MFTFFLVPTKVITDCQPYVTRVGINVYDINFINLIDRHNFSRSSDNLNTCGWNLHPTLEARFTCAKDSSTGLANFWER